MKKQLKSLLSVTFAAAIFGATASHAEDLLDVYRIAVESDPQLRAAEAGYRAAVEARPLARGQILPTVGAGASITRDRQEIGGQPSNNFTNSGYSLSLTQPLYHRDYFVQLRQADSQIAQATAQLDSARQTLVLRVSEAYFNVLAAADSLEFARAELRAISRQLEQTRQRFEVGLTAITDVREAQARFDQAAAQEIAAENQLAVSREVLREITGRAHRELAPLRAETPLLAPEPQDITQWVETALDQNLQLIAARHGLETARQQIELQRSFHYPTLDLVAQHRYSERATLGGAAVASDLESTSIGLQLNVPLYQGGRVNARTRQATQQFEQAREEVEQLRRGTERQTRSAFLGVGAGISQVRALAQALRSSETALEATQAGFEVGTRTAVDVLDAQRELFRAQRDYARARYDYILDTLRLRQAAGTLSVADLEQINTWLR